MKNLRTIFLNRILALVLTIVALMTGQEAWAESSWTVTNINGSSNTFTITRSEKGYAQTVHFRTVSLSAYAGQNFTAVDTDYTFLANEDEKTVTVTELTPSGSYKYQTGTTNRKYRFEVTDRAGFILASADRTMTNGTSINSSDAFAEKSVTVQSAEFKVTDKGYSDATNPARSVSSSGYYSLAAPKEYLVSAGAELHMTLGLDVKEVDDGYQHLQILVDNTSTCDGGNKNGEPGTPSLSRYMVSFAHDPGDKNTTYASYTFPLTTASDNCGLINNAWSNGVTNKLYNQKFYSGCRASDGKLILPTNFSTLVVRFDASGDNDDNWYAKNVKAYIQAVDGTAPTKLAVSVAPGRHSKGNTVYVSVAFSEIVSYSGTKKLNTNWGSLTYVAGSGTNVLTFKGTIPQNATGDLNITGFSGTIQDLAGNSLSGGVTASSICTLDDDFAYTIDEFQKDGDNYLIKTHEDLIGLAGYVNGGGATEGKTFLQVADIVFPHTTNWNNNSSTEFNYIAIGYYIDKSNESRFDGTYDGGGHTISGIRIYRGGDTNSDSYQGLFGIINLGSIVRNVNLADTRITGYDSTGGIVGYNYGTITDCTVAANVCIHSVITNSYSHGGIVGLNNKIVQRSVSSAILTVKSGTSGVYYGGIAGKNYSSTITDCIAVGAVIPDVNARGAIVGYQNNYCTLTRNYYHNCKVASDAVTPSGVGMGTEGSKTTSDVDGAQPLWAITLPTHASVVRTGIALPGTDNATYDNGADINGVPYAKGLSVVNLSYDPATITEGYDVLLSVKKTSDNTAVKFTDNGNHTYIIASMPAADITVSATEIPIIAYIDADGNPQSHACTPIVEGTTSYQTLDGTEGWYVVNSDVTISGTQGVKFLDQQVNIILCDGTTLTSNATTTGYDGIDANNGSLAIYGQSLGTGSIVATASDYSAISSKTSINLNGGIISGITNSGYAAITNSISSGSITIRRGNVTATGSTFGIRDLGKSSGIVILGGTVNATAHSTSGIGLYSAYRNISILGGNVTATVIKAGGYDATGTITLGYTTVDDRITASSYACATLTIADGQTLTDGYSANTYTGTLTDEQKAAIAGKTMMKALGDVSYIDENGETQTCSNYQILSDGVFISDNIIGNTLLDTWYVASGNYTFNATYLQTYGRVHIILCDGANFTVNGSGSYGIYAYNKLSIYGQSQDTGTLTVNVANASGKALYVDYGNLGVNGGVVNANGGDYGIYIKNGNLTVNGGSINCSANKGLYVNGDALMGSPLLAHHMPQYDIKGLLSVKLTMNSIGIMTYSGVNSLDFTNVSGLSAYVALSDADDKGNITLTRTYKPAGLTGMVLCGEPSTSYVVPTVKDKYPDVYQNNLLRHVIVATEIDKSDGYYTNYILAKKNGNVGFYPLSGKGTLKPYSAYLQLHKDDTMSRGLVLNFEEEGTPTGVGHTEITEGLARRPAGESQSTEMADAIYDLQGRRIEKPKKGLYIHGGKKVLVH